MLVLGIETSGEVAGLALAAAEGSLATDEFRHAMLLSRDLVPRIQSLLQSVGKAPSDLEGIAVSVGPGSFTGLRIGVTAAKTMAYALDIPVAAVGTLHALAADHAAEPPTLVCALLPSGEGQVYAALFQWTPNGLEPRAEELTLPVTDLAKRLARTPLNVLAVGDAASYEGPLRDALGQRLNLGQRRLTPSGATVARLGREMLLQGREVPAHSLAPRYLRPSTPEQRLRDAAGTAQ